MLRSHPPTPSLPLPADIIVADIAGFTAFSMTLEPNALMLLLDSIFTRFDKAALSLGRSFLFCSLASSPSLPPSPLPPRFAASTACKGWVADQLAKVYPAAADGSRVLSHSDLTPVYFPSSPIRRREDQDDR